jgi:hypothetical protein
MYMFLVETKGLSLEETAALFDGEAAETAITAHTGASEYREEGLKEDGTGYAGNELKV